MPLPYPIVKNKKSGFTLIELLVVVGIIGLLTGVGVASYNSFNAKRQVEEAAEELKTNLRLAQGKAVGNEKPSGCSGFLRGWGVEQQDSDTYRLYYQCGPDEWPNDKEGYSQIDLTNGITLGSFDVFFKVFGGTNLTDEQDITLTNGTDVTVTVSVSGEVTSE